MRPRRKRLATLSPSRSVSISPGSVNAVPLSVTVTKNSSVVMASPASLPNFPTSLSRIMANAVEMIALVPYGSTTLLLAVFPDLCAGGAVGD